MAIYIELNGERIYDPIDGLKNPTVSEIKNSGSVSRKFSKELKFFGRSKEIIQQELIDPIDGASRQIPIKIYDDCCSSSKGGDYEFFEGVIRGDNVDWCEDDCFVTGTATEDDSQISCLESTVIYDNKNGFQNRQHPNMNYCLEFRPSILHDAIIILGFAILMIFQPFRLLVFAFDLLIRLVEKIPGVNFKEPLKGGFSAELTDINDMVKSVVAGCGRRHPSPLVREYLDNVCEICGVSYQSSILANSGSDFYNTVMQNAPLEKGDLKNEKFKEDNAPIYSGTQFLDLINQVFNAEYTIEEGVVKQERHDLLTASLGNWIDYNLIKSQGRLKSSICYSWNGDDKPAYGRFEYSQDASDWVGNEAKSIYNDIVEWNKPYSPAQKGEHRVLLPLSMARFRNDGLDRDVLSFWDWLPFIGSVMRQNDNALIMNNGTSFNPKFLIWDGKDRKNAFVKKFHGVFNKPFHFTDKLYSEFHAISNPRDSNYQGFNFDFEFYYTCEELASYNINKGITIPKGAAKMVDVSINPEERTIKIKGRI